MGEANVNRRRSPAQPPDGGSILDDRRSDQSMRSTMRFHPGVRTSTMSVGTGPRGSPFRLHRGQEIVGAASSSAQMKALKWHTRDAEGTCAGDGLTSPETFADMPQKKTY